MINGRQAKSILSKLFRVASRIILSALFLLILLIILIRLPYVQNKLTQRAIVFLEEKIGTEVNLKRIYIQFPKKIVLEELFMTDQSSDTLIYAGAISIDTDLWRLLQHHVQLDEVELSNAVFRMRRPQTDSAFNFDYIPDSFAKESNAPDTSASKWGFSLVNVKLSRVDVSYQDHYQKNYLDVKLGNLDVELDKFDPSHSSYGVASIEMTDSRASASISGGKGETAAEGNPDENPSLLDLSFNKIHFQKVDFNFEQEGGQLINLLIGEFQTRANKFDLNKKIIDLDKIQLTKSFISFQQTKGVDQNDSIINRDTTRSGLDLTGGWDIKLKKLSLSGNGFQYDNHAIDPTSGGFDFNHFWIQGLQTETREIELNQEGIQLQLESLSLREKNGSVLSGLSFDGSLTNTELNVKNFLLASGNSKINLTVRASFTSLTDALESMPRSFRVELTDTHIALRDIQNFYPAFADSLGISKLASITINTSVKGTPESITISELDVRAMDSTQLSISGKLGRLSDLAYGDISLVIDQLYTTHEDLSKLFPDSVINGNMQIPKWLSVKGKVQGTVQAPEVDLVMNSSLGSVMAKGTYDRHSKDHYKGNITVKSLDVGRLMNNDELGVLTAHVSVNGSGLSLDSIDAMVDATIDTLSYKNYVYSDFKIDGQVRKYFFSGKASLHDKNLDFTVDGKLDYSNDTPRYELDLDLKNMDLQNLNLTARPLKARATLEANFDIAPTYAINGDISIRKVGIYNGQALYLVDSLLFASIDQEGESSISIRSDIISGDFKGTFSLSKLPKVLKQFVNQYFSVQDTSIARFESRQQFEFDLTLKNTDLLTEIILPDLKPFVPGKIAGEFDSELNILNLTMDVTRIRYGSVGVDSISFKVESDEEALKYRLRFKNMTMDSLRLQTLQLSGQLASDSLYAHLLIFDDEDKQKYLLSGVFNALDPGYRFHFIRDEVILNYKDWVVADDNYLVFGNGVKANNFFISRNSEKLSLVTSEEDSSYVFQFHEIALSNFTNVLDGIVPASGLLDGDLRFTTARKGDFKSNLKIGHFTILEIEWGNAELALVHSNDLYQMDLNVDGDSLKIQTKASYDLKPEPPTFDARVSLSPLNLAVIAPLSLGQLQKVNGRAEGTLTISGTMDQPVIRGDIAFRDANFLVTYLNNTFSLRNESISFRESGIVLNRFNLRDEKDNEAVLNGTIKTRAYQEFDFDISVNANNFQVLNTKEGDNSLYYGSIKVNAIGKITGSNNIPKVDLSVNLRDGSELTYVVPESEKNALEEKGIVQFVDRDAEKDPFLANLKLQDTVSSPLTGLDLTADVDLNDKSSLHIVLDPATGDQLSVQGNAKLALNLSPTGNIDLAGRYEISKGSYNFSFRNLVKRQFTIERGGYINWTGDPLNATMNIRAVYEVEASPIDLVYNQLSSNNQSEINTYSQRLPFQVYLLIQGRLLEPDIGFKIDMPEDQRNAMGGAVYAKLLDINTRESDLNKQVFALLILKRFISDNPLESQARSGFSNSARMSVSRMLSDQLNMLSQNVKGVELSFDVKSYEDYSGEEVQGETKVQLGVSKSLFNDRLVVKLSGNVDVEGGEESDATDYIGDLALEYKLTSDGRFRITGFRSGNFDVIDGELTETGVGLIFVKDYNTLHELFKSNTRQK